MTKQLKNSTSYRHDTQYGLHYLGNNEFKFNLWAPDLETVELIIKKQDGAEKSYTMDYLGDGWFYKTQTDAVFGNLYGFKVNDNLVVPDPASRYQPDDVHGLSQIIDPTAFDWEDEDKWNGRPWNETILYELHVGTCTQEGTFKALKEKLDYYIDLGITAIELMPLADFPGQRNWGYDGTLFYAPDSSYGTPDDLKDLIKTAHQKGLMVFLDVVYNHFGPDGNYLYVYAKSQFFTDKTKTPWGDSINYENRHVRDFIIDNVLYWLEEYRFDGLRFDAVHAIKDKSELNILDEIAQTVYKKLPNDRHIHLVLENDDNNAYLIKRNQKNEPENFIAQWNDDFHHAMHVLLTEDIHGYYMDYSIEATKKPPTWYLGRNLTEGFGYQGDPSAYRDDELRGQPSKGYNLSCFVNFIQNHDQIGNRAFGERLTDLASQEALEAAAYTYLLAPSIPLIYMGEEWASSTPFLFFCNFGEELSRAVTAGRRKEFEKFPEFSDPERRNKIPDPAIEETFLQSKLNWDEISEDKHAKMLQLYKDLLKARLTRIVPLIDKINTDLVSFEVINDTALKVVWPLKDEKNKLALHLNLGKEPVSFKDEVLDTLIAEYPTNAAKSINNDNTLPAWSVCWSLG